MPSLKKQFRPRAAARSLRLIKFNGATGFLGIVFGSYSSGKAIFLFVILSFIFAFVSLFASQAIENTNRIGGTNSKKSDRLKGWAGCENICLVFGWLMWGGSILSAVFRFFSS